MHVRRLADGGDRPGPHRPARRRAPATTSGLGERRAHLGARATGGGDGTSVVIGSQSFAEAALVTAMYQQLLEAGATRSRPSWSTPATIYMAECPTPSTSSLSTSPASSTPQHRRQRRRRQAAVDQRRPGDDRRRRAAARGEGHHPARPLPGVRRQRLLHQPGLLRLRGRHQALRPRGPEGRRWPPRRTARAAPTARRRLVDTYGIDVTLDAAGLRHHRDVPGGPRR